MSTISPGNLDYRSELQRFDWDFSGQNGTTGLAGYHWYPARYVPQLPGILITRFSDPGDLVIDPFCGSGTTLVEAYRVGRRTVGIDINPIAVLMTQAKLVPYDMASLTEYFNQLEKDVLLEGFTPHERVIPNRIENEKWYHPDTLEELAIIWEVLRRHTGSPYYAVAIAAFSAILRSVCSQTNHWGWICDNVRPKNVERRQARKAFFAKLKEFASAAQSLSEDRKSYLGGQVGTEQLAVVEGDAASVLSSFETESTDLVVTSPPYFGMTDYVRSQRLSFLWLELNMDSSKAREIGARYKRKRKEAVSEYLDDMRRAFTQISRVLKTDHFCCVVIGESPRHAPFMDGFLRICAETGLVLEDSLLRAIPKQRTISPSIHEERILVFRRGQA